MWEEIAWREVSCKASLHNSWSGAKGNLNLKKLMVELSKKFLQCNRAQHFPCFDLQVTCNQCGKECASVRDLDHHRRTDHIVASCELCGRPFYNPAGNCLFGHLDPKY